MAEDAISKVEIVFATKNEELAYKAVQKIHRELDATGQANTEFGKKVSQATAQVEKAFQSASTEVKNYEKVTRDALAAEDRQIAIQKKSSAAIKSRTDALRAQADAQREAYRAEQGSRGYRNSSTTLDTAIGQGEAQRSRELSSLKAEINLREELARIQGSSSYANANSHIDEEIADRNRLSSALRNEIQERDRLATIRGGRDYNNASVQIDQEIASRQKASSEFARGLQARLQEEEAAKKSAAATNTATAATSNAAGSLPRMRYALYDVSTTFAIAGAAATAFGAAVAGTAITMDRQFADVVRTTGTYMDKTGQQTSALRGEFNELFSTLPTSFSQLTEIGTLAGQLGVAQENVAEFTSLVAKFGAVTDVSVEQSATAFGRLSALLDVPADQYENLGSSILSVGVASVATESQIINTSSQIASMGSFAGFSADEVIGLSSALASLGVQPELSRGVVTRLFTNISKSIAEGGERLEEFGRLTGQSGQEFADAWGRDAAGTLTQFLSGLDREGGNAVATLGQLGITASRDIPTLLKLAQNSGLVAEQLSIATQGYAEGTSLQEQYGVIAETVASKLTILKNNFQLLIGTLGSGSGVLGPIVDGLTSLIGIFTAIANNKVASTIALISTGIVVLGGAIAVTVGVMARMAASGLAIRGALVDAAVATGAYATSADAATVSTRALAFSIQGVRTALISTGIGAAVVAIGTALAYFVGKAGEAGNAVSDLSEALVTDTRAGDGVAVATDRLVDYDRVVGTVKLTQEQWNDILYGGVSYAEAYAQSVDTATESVESFQVAVGEATKTEITDIFQNSDFLKDAFKDGVLPENLDFSALTDAIVAEGEKGGKEYLDAIFNPEALRARANELTELTTGIDTDWDNLTPNLDELEHTNQALALYDNLLRTTSDTSGNFTEAVDNARYAQLFMAEATEETGNTAQATADSMDDLADATTNMSSGIFDMINLTGGLSQSLYDLGQSVYENGDSFDALSQSGRQNLGALQEVFSATAEWAAANGVTFEDAMAQVGGAMVQAGIISVEQLKNLGVAGVTFGNDLLSVAEATSKAVASLKAQMASLQEANNGLTRGQSADGLRYAGQALAIIENGGSGAEKAMASMGLEFDRLESSGLDFDALLGSIGQGWDDAGTKAAGSGGKQKKAADTTKKAAKEAAEEVRTLADYVSDLSSVLGDTYDFQFGFDEATDNLADAKQKMVDYFTTARENVAKYKSDLRDANLEVKSIQASLKTLSADRSLLEYQLKVAVEYGDTLRAEQITAQLGENSADTAEKQADLADANKDVADTSKGLKDAQKALIPNLDGTTEASREQRDIMRGIVKANEDLVVAYANTGASQKQISAYAQKLGVDFRNQGSDFGYSTAQLKTYTTGMSEFKKAVDAVPRKLTVTATTSTSAAEKALQTFTAKKRTTAVTATVSTPSNSSVQKQGSAAAKAYKAGFGKPSVTVGIDFQEAEMRRLGKFYKYSALAAQYQKSYEKGGSDAALSNWKYYAGLLASGKYWDGGYTGRGGKYEAAGVVHKGEYVIPARDVNQSTGLPYADAMARLSRGTPSPVGYANGGYAQPAGLSGVVSLTPGTIQQIARAVQPYVVMNGQVVGEITSNQYAQGTRVGSN